LLTRKIPANIEQENYNKIHYNYLDCGFTIPTPVISPSLGIGKRFQDNHSGKDFSLHVTFPWPGLFSQVKGSVLYQYYPKPNVPSQFYFCIGGGIGFITDHFWSSNSTICLFPEFGFGKQFKNNSEKIRFWQIQIQFPMFSVIDSNFFKGGKLLHKRWLFLPVINFTYAGFTF
jgi:hypothetical protein